MNKSGVALFVLLSVIVGGVSKSHAEDLRVHCSSEDDGELVGTLSSKYPGQNPYFDGTIGTMGANPRLDIKVHAENFERLDATTLVGLVGICAIDNTYDVPLTCASSTKIFLEKGKNSQISLFALGQMDPEGIQCKINLE